MDDSGQEKELFVPVKAKRRQSSKQRLDTATIETLTLVKEAVQNCPTKELISFMKEEMEKSRQRELKFFQLFLTQRSEANFHSIPYSMNTDIMQILALTQDGIVVHRLCQVTQNQAYRNGLLGLDHSSVATPKYTRL